MPIDPQDLAAPENRHLLLSGDETLRQAFRRLVAPGGDGQPWWHLVVSLGGGRWAAATFEHLYARAEEDRRVLDTALRDLEALLALRAVEQESIGTARARQLARTSPGGLIAVTRGARLAGILCAPTFGGGTTSTQQIGQLLAETPLAGQTAFTSPRRRTVRRYTDVSCPDRVAVDTPRFNLVVRLTVERPSHDPSAPSVDPFLGEPVWVELRAPEFVILNAPRQEIHLLPDRDSPPVVFDLQPRRTGHHRVELDLFQQTAPLGMVSLPVWVTAAAGPSRSVAASLDLPPGDRSVPPPDFVLRIFWAEEPRGHVLRFSLLREGGAGWDEFTAVRLGQDPAGYAARLVSRFTDLATAAARSSADRAPSSRSGEVLRELRTKGQNLWEILPAEFRALYARERAAWRDRSLLIVSDEPHIPWELTWPWGEDWEDEEPWCVTLRLSRWLRRDRAGNGNAGAPAVLPLRSLACLAAGDVGLAAAGAERNFLRDLASRHDVKDLTPPDFTRRSLIALLRQGGYDWLHLATHGSFSAEAPDEGSAIRLGDLTHLTPEDLVGPEITRHLRKQRPAFVLNACDSGRLSWGLVGLGGWASRLLGLGAGMFLGTLWPVNDAAALALIRVFYERLLAGDAVAEALREARRASRSPHDPSWLAYSLYCHPNARCASAKREGILTP
jgi:hypothetical protein